MCHTQEHWFFYLYRMPLKNFPATKAQNSNLSVKHNQLSQVSNVTWTLRNRHALRTILWIHQVCLWEIEMMTSRASIDRQFNTSLIFLTPQKQYKAQESKLELQSNNNKSDEPTTTYKFHTSAPLRTVKVWLPAQHCENHALDQRLPPCAPPRYCAVRQPEQQVTNECSGS